jgi:predicted transcriptional regulator
MPELRDVPAYPSVQPPPSIDVRLYIIKSRTQIYLDEAQTAKLDEMAAAERTTRSSLIRLAIDAYIDEHERKRAAWRERWQEAVAATAGIAPYLEDGAEYVEKLRRAGAERLTELEER